MHWKKILCPTDFSPGARDALLTAASLAAQSGAELVIVHVWAPPVFFMVEPIGLPPGVVAEMANTAETRLAESIVEARGGGALRVTPEFRTGAAWHEVVALATQDVAIDLIVVGTHGRTGLKHAVMGSVAEKVVRHAPCPVLVVRTRTPST